MEYQYLAYTPTKGIFKGKVDAPDSDQASAAVGTLGYSILKMSQVRRRVGADLLFPSLFKVGISDVIQLSRQINAMLSSGGSLMRALEMAESEAHSRMMRRAIADMREVLAGGGSLSEALAAHPKIFDKLFVSVVKVGEFTGRLGPSLEQLADMLEADREAKARAMKTMMYPLTVVGMSVVTLEVLMTVAVPPLLKVFDQLGAETPAMTRAAVGMVNFAKGQGLQILMALFAFFVAISVLRRIPAAAGIVDGALAALPMYGPLTIAGDLARFSRTMAMLLEAGVPVSDALMLGIAGCKNVRVREAFLAGEESLLSGHGLAQELRRHRVLPSLFLELVSMGEEGNHLAKMMSDAATTYRKERDERLGSLLGALEPLSTVLVGAIVAFIAFSMFVPIYSGLDALG